MKVKSLTKEEIGKEIAALEKTVNCVSHKLGGKLLMKVASLKKNWRSGNNGLS